MDVLPIIKISPKYASDKINPETATIEDYIDVYEDRVFGWYFQYAEKMKTEPHSGYAILLILFTQVEPYAVLVKGESSEGRSKEMFSYGLTHIFQDVYQENKDKWNQIADFFYSKIRCGFFHDGGIRDKVSLTIEFNGDRDFALVTIFDDNKDLHSIYMNPHTLVSRFNTIFNAYIAALRDPNARNDELRQNFMKGWEIIHTPK